MSRRAPGSQAWIVVALRRLSVLAMFGGLGLIGIAVVWWATFYRPYGLAPAVSCLYARGGSCGFIIHIAGEAGRVAYSPSVLWLGVFSLVGGTVARLLLAIPI
jgi:hypothetical protein